MAGLNLTGVLADIATLVEGSILLDTVRITRPAAGPPVFNPDTGEYTYPEAEILYEGPGAVQTAGTAAEVVSTPTGNLPWVAETRSKYRLLTPLETPIAEKDMLVSVVEVHTGGDLALLGRQWRAQDPGGAGTLGVVRTTAIDQVQSTREAS